MKLSSLSSWSPVHVMTQLASVLHGTSDVDRTLLLLELLHFFLKIHRLNLIALDRCEWPRTSPSNFSCSGYKPFPQLRETRHLV